MILVLIAILAILAINQNIALTRLRAQYPAPGKLVEVDAHKMHLDCMGTGSPTVVIDAGNSSFSLEWTPIQEQLNQEVRVCTYDRAGYGWSEPGPQRRDGAQVVAELHSLLQAAGETGPYLLVGHSLGGVHVRMYAAQYPQEVAGLVLVDTAYPLVITPEFEQQMAASIGFYQVMGLLTRTGVMRILGPLGSESSLPETARKLPAELQEAYLNLLLDPAQYAAAISEMQSLPRTFEQAGQMLDQHGLGDLPLIVLTAGQTAAAGSTPFAEQRLPASELQIAQQKELAGTSTRGEQRIIHESGHLMHLDAPQAVLLAVQDLVEIARMSK
jgi:pimeloyl-ACP methyl ester carboxylesterase